MHIIEVIIAIQLFVIVISLLYSVFVFNQRFTLKWLDYSENWNENLVKLNFIENELKTAKEISKITNNEIHYKNRNYLPSLMFWKSDSIFFSNELKSIVISDLSIKEIKKNNSSNSENTFFMIYFSEDSLFINSMAIVY